MKLRNKDYIRYIVNECYGVFDTQMDALYSAYNEPINHSLYGTFEDIALNMVLVHFGVDRIDTNKDYSDDIDTLVDRIYQCMVEKYIDNGFNDIEVVDNERIIVPLEWNDILFHVYDNIGTVNIKGKKIIVDFII